MSNTDDDYLSAALQELMDGDDEIPDLVGGDDDEISDLVDCDDDEIPDLVDGDDDGIPDLVGMDEFSNDGGAAPAP